MRGGTAKRLEFEYTGTYNERLDDGVVELLTSGVLTFKRETAIDAFWLEVEVAAVLGKTRTTRQAAMAVGAALVVTQKPY